MVNKNTLFRAENVINQTANRPLQKKVPKKL